jgi:large conductance mechanosensitive channel
VLRSLRSLVKLVAGLINLMIGILMSGIDFAGLLATVGEAELMCGNFIMAIINFLVIALLVFKLARSLNKMKEAEEAAPATASACPT